MIPASPIELPSSLQGGGDCFDHYHSSDRAPSHDTLARLQQLEKVVTVTATYAALSADDYIIGDTTAGGFTITLAAPKSGRRVIVMKSVAANTLTVASASNINGAATAALTTRWSILSLKAIDGLGWVNG